MSFPPPPPGAFKSGRLPTTQTNLLPEIQSLSAVAKADITRPGVPNWKKLVAIKAPSAGSHDTMFVQTEDGVFVVKPDPEAFNEKETTEWLDSLPIDVPRIRLIATNSEEGKLAIAELTKFDDRPASSRPP